MVLLICVFSLSNSYAVDLMGSLDPLCRNKNLISQVFPKQEIFKDGVNIQKFYDSIKNNPNVRIVRFSPNYTKNNLIVSQFEAEIKNNNTTYQLYIISENKDGILKQQVMLSGDYACSKSDSTIIEENNQFIDSLPFIDSVKNNLKTSVKATIQKKNLLNFDPIFG